MLIDGGLKGTFTSPTFEEVKQRFEELQDSDPFVDLLGIGLPWATGAFAQSAALYARRKSGRPSVLQQYPPIPPEFKAPVRHHERGSPWLRVRREPRLPPGSS